MNQTVKGGQLARAIVHLHVRNASTISTNVREVNKALGFFGLRRKVEVMHQIFGIESPFILDMVRNRNLFVHY